MSFGDFVTLIETGFIEVEMMQFDLCLCSTKSNDVFVVGSGVLEHDTSFSIVDVLLEAGRRMLETRRTFKGTPLRCSIVE